MELLKLALELFPDGFAIVTAQMSAPAVAISKSIDGRTWSRTLSLPIDFTPEQAREELEKVSDDLFAAIGAWDVTKQNDVRTVQ